MIHPARVHLLNSKPAEKSGGFVLYWMQQSQRAEWNHALEYAIRQANRLGLPPVVVFGLMENYPEANERHLSFMMEGLVETFQALKRRGISAWIGNGHPAEVALQAGRGAALIVCDAGYLRHQAEWRARVAEEADCRVVEVESDVIIPVETASDHAEYMARTLRPKLLKNLDEFLKPVRTVKPAHGFRGSRLPAEIKEQEFFKGFEQKVPGIKELKTDRSVGPSAFFKGGTAEAEKRLKTFIKDRLIYYSRHSNQPQTDDVSGLAPYLHFGQISPLYIALQVKKSDAPESEKKAFLEQLLIRRELAVNFVWFTRDYDRFSCLPEWVGQTLKHHAEDRREILYSREELEQSRTHDPYWNAAMDEMRVTGFMHNYMRMYWGKKILEWSPSPEEAFATVLALNNKYFLDGRDPNSYAGAAWIFGKHDQAWAERKIFGKVRYMNAAGLERKCDIRAYVQKISRQIN